MRTQLLCTFVKRNRFKEKGLIIPDTFPEAKKEPATIIVASKIYKCDCKCLMKILLTYVLNNII